MAPDILTAMFTPVVLISACASLLISTSNRLSRVVDETRSLSQRIEDHVNTTPESAAQQRHERVKRTLLIDQLAYMIRRSRLLQTGLAIQYGAVVLFVATCVVLGTLSGLHLHSTWVAIALGFVGMILLLVSTTYLTLEARLALHTTSQEMAWMRELLSAKEDAASPLPPQLAP